MRPSAGERLFERLEVLHDPAPNDGPFNMALDEALLARLGDVPVLRTYRWRVPTVSLGYFEKLTVVREAFPGRALVRRWTGGGSVEHGEDFTYSLLVPRAHPLARRAVMESYRLIHGAVALALAGLGGRADLNEAEAAPGRERSRACFASPVRFDLMRDGRKVAGAAQRRTRHGLLHQGSVQGLAPEECSGRLATFLPDQLSTRPVPRAISPELVAAARRLAEAKYSRAEWLARF